MARQKEEKDGKGKMGFMQKYYHKGVFFSDEAAAAGLDKRDLAGARFADEIKDRSVLPEYLQKRDMTKLGRKGGTKYKDLRSEDTGRWGDFNDRRGDRDGNYAGRYGDVDDRFRPDASRHDRNGANAIPLGERKGGGSSRAPDRPSGERSQRDREERRDRSRDRGDSYRRRDGSRDDDRRRHRSRSGSPRRRRDSRDDRDRRKRSPSQDRNRHHESDKRRRVDSR
ncbi:Putative ATP-dependent RNA helicase prh1 [Verticillium dahliae VDG2]|nr:Putative ATP-dependent RNA helicase prh1 [Verticillium dahliae VDG2]